MYILLFCAMNVKQGSLEKGKGHGDVEHSTHPKKSMSNFTFWVPLNLLALSNSTSVWKMLPLLIIFLFSLSL
jgi:hypothetical protein